MFGRESKYEWQEVELLQKVLESLKRIEHNTAPRKPIHVKIHFLGANMAGNPLTLNVGQTSTATVQVLDQFGQVFPFDFAANPPVWAVDNTASVGLAAGSSPDAQVVNGIAAGSGTLTVDVPGVSNGHDEETVTVVAPQPVASTVKVVFTQPA